MTKCRTVHSPLVDCPAGVCSTCCTTEGGGGGGGIRPSKYHRHMAGITPIQIELSQCSSRRETQTNMPGSGQAFYIIFVEYQMMKRKISNIGEHLIFFIRHAYIYHSEPSNPTIHLVVRLMKSRIPLRPVCIFDILAEKSINPVALVSPSLNPIY